jgi:ATP-dependent protease HslVU (ClpYQ) peptidase subunit
LFGLWILISVSCARQHIVPDIPQREGVSIEQELAQLNRISSVEAVLSVDYEKDDALMSGDAFLIVSAERLVLRVYYLGFVAGEVTEERGVVRSTPKLDRTKRALLVDGLRSSVFWWKIQDFSKEEREDSYVLRNSAREIVVDKKTLLPISQILLLDTGEFLSITYSTPVRMRNEKANGSEDERQGVSDVLSSGFWYPSEITVQLRNHLAKVRVKEFRIMTNADTPRRNGA